MNNKENNKESEDKISAQIENWRARIFPRAAGPRLRESSTEIILAAVMLLFAIGFNLWIYRLEPTAKIDPNDNLFQFALVYRTNQIWDYAQQKCSINPVCFFSYLSDHWVPNWNEGYNLPFYYSHIPQIVIVGTWRIVSSAISLFTYYHVVIYLLLCLFPLTMFLALRIAGFSWVTAGFSALLASQISTDGLYGLDPPSFLWRGYGLSSQLFAMIFLPLAIAYAYRYFMNNESGIMNHDENNNYHNSLFIIHNSNLFFAVLFLVLTTMGHLGVGIMAFLSLIPLAILTPKKSFKPLIILSVISIFLLSYWIVPAFLGDKFHNFSFWDPVWKFNSYGAKETIARLFNGDLFDFGRLPVFTALVLVGVFINPTFAVLFVFWLLLYFGRTTWGNLINLIPSMREFHLSRFIVGVHLAGLFLAPIGLGWVTGKFKKIWFLPLILLIPLIPIYIQTINYNDLNNTLILRANKNYDAQSQDANALVDTLKKLPPGRVFSGRGGSWGKDFKLAETDMTMYLGNFALPTVLWLPETWSPNGDTEQYFREDKAEDYDLYNIKYVATPINLPKDQIQPFWKKIAAGKTWILYSVEGPAPRSLGEVGYFTAGVRPAIVAADKYSRANVVRLWIQSDDSKNGLYPELSFDINKYPVNVGLPNFKMLDEVTYVVPERLPAGQQGSTHNVFSSVPRYVSPLNNKITLSHLQITDQKDNTDMVFSARAQVPAGCTECLVILKQTYHPNWRVTVDGSPVTPIIVFPFYIGIPVTEGTHQIVASYEPSRLKIFLLYATGIILIGGIIFYKRVLSMIS